MRVKLRLVPVAAAAWLVAGVSILAPAISPLLAVLLWTAAFGTIVWIARGRVGDRMPRHLLPIVVLSLVAAAGAASHVAFAQPGRLAAAAVSVDGGRAISLTATVVGKVERRADGALAFDAVGHEVEVGGERRTLEAEIVVRVAPDDVSGGVLDVGAEIVVAGTAVRTDVGERAVLAVRASRGLEVVAEAGGVNALAGALRRGLVAAVDGLPGPGAGLVPGLAVGDTSAVDPELDAAMKQASLSHLTAVSGANCALVVGLAFASAAVLGASRRGRVVVGLLALLGFVVLVTPEPSVVRAGAMAAIAMLAVLLGRPAAGMSVLALAVAVLLVLDPWLAASLGFALSTAATVSLLLAARPLAAGLARHLPRALALALSVPLAAQLACGPLLVLIAPTVPIYGVLANLLAAPAAPLATVAGLAACLAAPLPWLQDGLAAIAWLPASWIAATATVTTGLPADSVPWVEGPLGAALLAVVGVAIGLAVALRPGGPRSRRVARVTSVLLVGVLTGALAGSSALGTFAGRWTLPAQWSVLACDVGQGDAVLLRSAGVVALVDTGPDATALDSCLIRAGIDRIDLLVLTHFDLDHVGGVAAVIGRVGTVLHRPAPDAQARAVVGALTGGGARATSAETGMLGSLGDARWRVLWPRPESRAFPAGNDASVVLDVRGGGIPSILLLGDLSAAPQAAVEASGALDPPYTTVKIAHHGSADQDAGLYATAAPGVALVSVGADNDYGHPRDETLSLLDGLGAVTARTDRDGPVALWLEEGAVRVWRDRVGSDVGAGG